MGDIQKGVILSFEGEKDQDGNYKMARVQSLSAGAPTLPINISKSVRGEELVKGTKVVFATFEDSTGVILAKMEGD